MEQVADTGVLLWVFAMLILILCAVLYALWEK